MLTYFLVGFLGGLMFLWLGYRAGRGSVKLDMIEAETILNRSLVLHKEVQEMVETGRIPPRTDVVAKQMFDAIEAETGPLADLQRWKI